MASSRVLEREVLVESRPANLSFSSHKYSLLIITGRTDRLGQSDHIRGEIERGIRSWDVDLKSCNLNLYLQEFLSHHTVSFKGVGQKCLRHCTRVLDIQVLISPSQEQAQSEVFALLSRESAHKLLVLCGLTVEESGDVLFHRGLFSPHQLKEILAEQFLDQDSTASHPFTKISLTLSCPNVGHWRKTLLDAQPLQGPFTLYVNPPVVLPAMESLGEYTALVSSAISPPSPFDLLPPPTTVGFLKLSRPCCYVFPAGCGDCAFFAVNGFTVLVDGGSDSQACFWKLVRHLDRVDAVLLTHIGTENLPGVVSFLERKVAELGLSSEVKDDYSKKLISPELGVVFFNAPSRLQVEQISSADNLLKSTHQANVALQLLKRLHIKPQPMFRPQGARIESIILFQKMGVGQLELYILSPGKNCQEYQTFMQSWPDGVSSDYKTQKLPLTALASVSALLVWHPACPQEKVVRVLFPGVTPQAKLLQGLEKLKGLAFLQKPMMTTGDLEKLEKEGTAKRTESQDSSKSQEKGGLPKQGKEKSARDEGNGVSKEKGKAYNGVASKETEKAKIKETSVKHKAKLSERNSMKKGGGSDIKKEKNINKIENSVTKNDIVKMSKPKTENKSKLAKETKLAKDAKNDFKTGEKKPKKPSGKAAHDSKKVQVNHELPNNNSTKHEQGNVSKIPDSKTSSTGQTMESDPAGNPYSSKISTPEDMTADFLRLREEEETKTTNIEKEKSSESENKGVIGSQGQRMCNEAAETSVEKSVGVSRIMEIASDNNALLDNPETSEKANLDPQMGQGKAAKPARVAGFPSPLNKAPMTDPAVMQDITPTEYTLLDGALRHSPHSQSSPENRGPTSPDEQTSERDSPKSRPNSAGHTPYCLSPDDVWLNRATLNRVQAEMNNLDSADVSELLKRSELKSIPESHTNSKEKHLSFLSLGPLKEGPSDPSPSVATTTTTTTTHSMPAEVSSPQSTEVDESLSMSFEQGPTNVSQKEGDDSLHHSNSNGGHFMGMPLKKPNRCLGSGSGGLAGPNGLHCDASSHQDVDLCLVSPCEFKHFKPAESSVSEGSRGGFAPHHHSNNNNNPKDLTPSESNAPVCTEDCPSTTADGLLDSDEEDSCSEPSNAPHNRHTSPALPSDPPPAPFRDSPPLPPHPDVSMPVPQSDADVHGKRAKASGTRGKKGPGAIESPQKSSPGKSRTGNQSGAAKGNVTSTRAPSSSTRSAPAKSSPNTDSKAASASEVSIYVDLAYIPSGAASPTVSVDFFRCVRSSCYIISGDSHEREELMRQTLDALLDGKSFWLEDIQVTLIPTFESVSMQEWYQQTLDRQKDLGITVLGSNSTVAMQDETFPACKIEF